MSNFPKFTTGNIVKSPQGDLWIVASIDEKRMSAISFNYTNTTLGCTKETTTRGSHECECLEMKETPDPNCPECKGIGEVKNVFHGYEEYTFVASTVKDFIESRMLRIFDL
jgi:hypothetical protein